MEMTKEARDRLGADVADMSVADAGLLGVARKGRNRRLNDVAKDLATLLSAYDAKAERLRVVEEAAADVLALPVAVKALDYLDRGIGTKTREAAWICLRQATLTQSPPAMENPL